MKNTITSRHDLLIQQIIEKNLIINIDNYKQDILISAIAKDYKSIIHLFLEYLYNIKIDLVEKQTLFLYIANIGQEVPAVLLIKRGANINTKYKIGKSVFAYTSKYRSLAFLQKLIDLGANVIDPDKFGDILLYYTAG